MKASACATRAPTGSISLRAINHAYFLGLSPAYVVLNLVQIPNFVLPELMKKHSFATWQILRRIGGLEEIARWADEHHESLDGGGYPFRFLARDLSVEARIIKVADIYQALAQKRPYRGPMPTANILKVLRNMQAAHMVDPQVVEMVAGRIDDCHAAAVGAS